MARIVGRLKSRHVVNAKPPKGKDAALIPDGGNLYLQLTRGKGGHVARSWTFKYELHGKRHELGLGPLHTRGLAEARDKARSLRQQLLDGIDPLIEKKRAKHAQIAAQAKIVTFRECAEAYFKAHRDGWKNRKHAAQWQSTLEQFVYPKIGAMSVADVGVDDVIRVIEPIWKTIPETASRVRGRVESILGYATVRQFRHGDNPARWRGHLAELLPAKGKVRAVKHHAALPYSDVPALMAQLCSRKSRRARALEFTVLTAARAGEVLGATWDEIDLKSRTWTIPASRMKAGREHRVPLADRPVVILREMAAHDGQPFRLTSRTVLALLQTLRPGATTHGMRSAFRDWAAERTNYPNHVVEQALAHAVGDKVEAAYRRTDLFERRRRLMNEWARYCAKPAPLETVGKVVPLDEARRG
jgi:integrase